MLKKETFLFHRQTVIIKVIESIIVF